MNSKIILGCLLTVLVAACSKDKFATRPKLTFKSVNTTTVSQGQDLIFKLEYTDKEGDVYGHAFDQDNPSYLDSLVVVERTSKNCEESHSLSYYTMPEIPEIKDTKGQLEVAYSYSLNGAYPILTGSPCQGKNDSCIFRFVLKDRARNISDTVSSPLIVILNQ